VLVLVLVIVIGASDVGWQRRLDYEYEYRFAEHENLRATARLWEIVVQDRL
jgi:hypothetical protein